MTESRHTASPNVHIIDNAFFMPQLNRNRRIWLYLPKEYEQVKKKYPVLYMQDGQNLFDEATAFSGEWEIDKTLNTLPNPCIVVGIDNGGDRRMNEYNLNDSEQFGKAEGELYLDFIVNTLKPFIDKRYRTMRSKKHTCMAGSSMGALISFYAGILYPHIFGGLGIFSPSFWAAPKIADQIKHLVKPRKNSNQRYYFYGGGMENFSMISDILQVAELMKQKAGSTIEIVANEKGWHSEACWKKEFTGFYLWMMQ